MEPVTHILTGACLARAGCNRRAAYATLTMAVAAELPDIDTLWGLRGPVEGFTHHRGITHTLVGLPVEAALLVAGVYGLHRWRVTRAARGGEIAGQPAKLLTAAPVRWGTLYGLALVALLSHLLLDFTNNYGIRPLFPFDPRWFAASIVFIFDPLIFLLLVLGLLLPALFGMIGTEVGARRELFRGRGWAIAALMGIVGVWTVREVEHDKALDLVMAQSLAEPAKTPAITGDASAADAAGREGAEMPVPAVASPIDLPALRALVSPDPFSPFRWPAVTDFGPVYQRSLVDTLAGAVSPGGTVDPKPERSAAVLAAQASPLGRAYMDWSPMPFVTVSRGDEGGAGTGSGETLVTFRDPRFMAEIPLLGERGRTALTAKVWLDAANRVVRQAMDGRTER